MKSLWHAHSAQELDEAQLAMEEDELETRSKWVWNAMDHTIQMGSPENPRKHHLIIENRGYNMDIWY
jgi:hypothetical protein